MIPHWQGRVSPVFDTAAKALLVDVEDSAERSRRDVSLEGEEPMSRAAALVGFGTDVLVCGAISRGFERAVVACGIDVIPQICGDVENVLAALVAGRLRGGAFRMPGYVRPPSGQAGKRRRGRRFS